MTQAPIVFGQRAVLHRCKSESLLTAGTSKHLRSVSQKLRRALIRAGLSVLKFSTSRYTDKEYHGFTFAAIIGESHVAGDTWPEKSAVFVNIAVCNGLKGEGNEKKLPIAIRELKRFFKSRRAKLEKRSHMSLEEPTRKRLRKRTKKKRRS